MNPYILMPQQVQDTSGLQAVYQNTAAQDALRNQAIMQGNQMTADAGRTAQGGGFNPAQLAQALRKTDPNQSSALGARVDMALNSRTNPYLQSEVSKLGSSTWNPMSDYNMGTNGWGNYGE